MTDVWIVGAGPGDPGLLTVRALELLRSADVVFHDDLVPPAITNLTRQPIRYEGVWQLLDAARAGGTVVRLQIGDPTIFGRLVPEMEALDAAGLTFEIIPGVTAATYAAAREKISLTHSTLAKSVAFVAGNDPETPIPDADTIVLYMPRRELPGPCRIFREDRPGRESVSIAIYGNVTALSSLPLYGQRIVVTRANSGGFDRRLRELGAIPVAYPVIRIDPPADEAPLVEAIATLASYDWIIFTSANGVRAFFDRLPDIRALRARLCAIGPATRAEIERFKLIVDVTPADYVGEGIVAALPIDLQGQRILIPRASVARDVVPDTLRDRGAYVDVVAAYRTVVPQPPPHPHGAADWITFTSSSTVKNYLAIAGPPNAHIASIGPITSATLREHGLEPTVEASEYTTDGLATAIAAFSAAAVRE